MYLFKYVTLKNLIPFRFLSSKLVVRLGWNFFVSCIYIQSLGIDIPLSITIYNKKKESLERTKNNQYSRLSRLSLA